MNNTPAYNIDDLLVKYLLQEATVPEQQEVDKWLKEADANQQYFNQFALIWEESRKLAMDSVIDENAAWGRFLQKKDQHKEPGIFFLNRASRWPKLLAAAILIGLIVISFIYWPAAKNQTQLAMVSSGSTTLIDSLADGTIVTLNKNSSIAYNKSLQGDTRNVTLKGEAFFNVAPDKHKPFIISINDVTIKVVGTSFNVKNINGNTEVIVESGIVEVRHKTATIDLKPREKILVNSIDKQLRKDSSNSKLYKYYRTKIFVCDNTPLWQLVTTLNEAYDAHIIIQDRNIANLPLTTTFNEEPLNKILSIVSATLNISATQKDDKIILH